MASRQVVDEFEIAQRDTNEVSLIMTITVSSIYINLATSPSLAIMAPISLYLIRFTHLCCITSGCSRHHSERCCAACRGKIKEFKTKQLLTFEALLQI